MENTIIILLVLGASMTICASNIFTQIKKDLEKAKGKTREEIEGLLDGGSIIFFGNVIVILILINVLINLLAPEFFT